MKAGHAVHISATAVAAVSFVIAMTRRHGFKSARSARKTLAPEVSHPRSEPRTPLAARSHAVAARSLRAGCTLAASSAARLAGGGVGQQRENDATPPLLAHTALRLGPRRGNTTSKPTSKRQRRMCEQAATRDARVAITTALAGPRTALAGRSQAARRPRTALAVDRIRSLSAFCQTPWGWPNELCRCAKSAQRGSQLRETSSRGSHIAVRANCHDAASRAGLRRA